MIRKINKDTRDTANHTEMLALAKKLSGEARGGYQGTAMAPLVEAAFPGSQITRAEMTIPHPGEGEHYHLHIRMKWEGADWVLRGNGNTIIGAVVSCTTHGALVQDDDYEEGVLAFLENETPTKMSS